MFGVKEVFENCVDRSSIDKAMEKLEEKNGPLSQGERDKLIEMEKTIAHIEVQTNLCDLECVTAPANELTGIYGIATDAIPP